MENLASASPTSIASSTTTTAANHNHNGKHWSQIVHESCLIVTSVDLIEDILLTKLNGGSDNGQFIYLDSSFNQNIFKYAGAPASTRLEPNEILLEIEKQKVSGFTLFDVLNLIKTLSSQNSQITFRSVRSGLNLNNTDASNIYLLPIDLRQYLDERFQKSSIDYDLQQIIRENVYMRTVPCTTRAPRQGEINGQDYIFLSNEEFLELENNGDLLEYGIYNGHYYGTPKPPKQPFINTNFNHNSTMLNSSNNSSFNLINNQQNFINNKENGGGSSSSPLINVNNKSSNFKNGKFEIFSF
jgi:hypothetical protein